MNTSEELFKRAKDSSLFLFQFLQYEMRGQHGIKISQGEGNDPALDKKDAVPNNSLINVRIIYEKREALIFAVPAVYHTKGKDTAIIKLIRNDRVKYNHSCTEFFYWELLKEKEVLDEIADFLKCKYSNDYAKSMIDAKVTLMQQIMVGF